MSSVRAVQPEPQVSIEDRELAAETLNRVGTCLAWQWMCPTGCGYIVGITADQGLIVEAAARHLRWHRAFA